MPRKTSLLNVDDANITASSLFKFKKLFLNEDLRWSLQLVLRTTLPESFREYKFKFSLNTAPHKMRIADLEKRKADIKADAQGDLFPTEGARKTQLKNIDVEIDEVNAELAEDLKSTPEIEFDGIIDKLEYKDGNTIIVFSVPANSVKELNDNRSIYKNYKLELIRE